MQGFRRQAAWALDSREAGLWQVCYGIVKWLSALMNEQSEEAA